MAHLEYAVKLLPEPEGGFTVRFLEFPEAITYGEDEAEAVTQAVDCLETVLAFKLRDGEHIPRPRKHKGLVGIPVPPLTAAKLLLYWEMKKQGIRKAGLARKLKWHSPQVDRLFDIRHESKLSQLEMAFAALGKTLTVGVMSR